MTEARQMLSVGIDVGTTTTQVVFSRLMLNDVARPGQIPRINITDKAILYQSPIVFTPLSDGETIDVDRLTEFVRGEYASAGVDPKQVETGAVIITGETAKKKNADQILQSLGGMAGEFVVTVAGPHLESLIAGRGAGAALYSQQHFCRVTNVDIGGGSANSALFRMGEMLSAAAMNYGGRILEIEPGTGAIRHIALPAGHILHDLGLNLIAGDRPFLADLRRFTDRMADLTVDLIEGTTSPLAQKLYLTPPAPVSGKGTLLMFSGGIGHYFYEPVPVETMAQVTIHGDVGPLLSDSLRRHLVLQSYQVTRPAETLRATVLGASSHTVALSGSTIWAEREILPLRNIPVIRPALDSPAGSPAPETERMVTAIGEAVHRWDIDLSSDDFAIVVEINRPLDYNSMATLANGLTAFARQALPEERPLIIIIQRDYAQVLGQTIKSLAPGRPLLVIDQVGLEEGDYIDVGTPLMDGRVVPVSVKTLIFYH